MKSMKHGEKTVSLNWLHFRGVSLSTLLRPHKRTVARHVSAAVSTALTVTLSMHEWSVEVA